MRQILLSRGSRRERTECKDILCDDNNLLTLLNRFRWVFCQLEVLQDCLPSSVRRTLDELPESLDETYERILREIKRPSREHAHRLLQCLTVAIRPLRVEELAELLAYDFSAAEGGIPKVNPNWRWKDHEEAVLSTCSSLIAVVGDGDSRVVQFSHFSVKEFLTSNRLATSGGDVSHRHISLEPAHTLLAQACLGTLLSLDDTKDGGSESADRNRSLPMAGYAAEHWMAHARVDKVSSRVQGGMEQLFDASKPHFSAWIQLHDVDDDDSYSSLSSEIPIEPEAAPLYYAACCGLPELVEHLLTKHPLHANTRGGRRGAALHAASHLNHVKVARLLERGSDVDVQVKYEYTPLRLAASKGNLEMGRLLLDHGADVDSRDDDVFWTPLHSAAWNGYIDFSQMLLEHRADVNSRDNRGRVPLHRVSEYSYTKGDCPGVVRLLLEHGADIDAKDEKGTTPVHLASFMGRIEVLRLLLDHGADADAEDNMGRTPLQVALKRRNDAIAQMLTEHGAQLHRE